MPRALDRLSRDRNQNERFAFSQHSATRDFQNGDIYTLWLDDFLRAGANLTVPMRRQMEARAIGGAVAAAWCHTGKGDPRGPHQLTRLRAVTLENRRTARAGDRVPSR